MRSTCSSLVPAVLLLALTGVGGAQTRGVSAEATSHLAEITSLLRNEWLHRDRMDWESFRRRVLERAAAAQTIPDTHDAIRLALTLLGDRHTYYVPASGEVIFNPESPTRSTGECTPAPFVVRPLSSGIGYVRIQITPPTSAAAIQEAIRKGDGPNTVGWIVDLRNSRGGNMWPALAGVGSLLGDGTLGFFVDAAERATSWGYADGAAVLDGDLVAHVEAPHRVTNPKARVAVLTDIGVASSGEAIAVAFRGRPNTRSFGTPTCGLSTAVKQFPLTTGGRLAIVVAVMADRTMTKYGGAIQPDEPVIDPVEAVPRAFAWLRGQ